MLITPFFSSSRRATSLHPNPESEPYPVGDDETPSQSQVRDFPRRRRATSLHSPHLAWAVDFKLPGNDQFAAVHDPSTQYTIHYLDCLDCGAELDRCAPPPASGTKTNHNPLLSSVLRHFSPPAIEIQTMRKSLLYAILRHLDSKEIRVRPCPFVVKNKSTLYHFPALARPQTCCATKHAGVSLASQKGVKMKIKMLLSIALAMVIVSARADGQTNSVSAAAASGQTVETIVCIRHGEKPPAGLGQLNCRGLNRSLALPNVLLGKFGPPQFLFAPNPSQRVKDKGGHYDYVRPLATIEPTAIRCGLPINAEFGFREIDKLEKELRKPEYQNAVILVAWEHVWLDNFAKNLVQDNGGDPKQVPLWADDDFDSIFVLRITSGPGQKAISFSIEHEGLNGLSDACP